MANLDPGCLPNLDTREDYFDYLEGYAVPTVDELEDHRSRRPLVKTYMLETVAHGVHMPQLSSAFPSSVRLERVDDELYRVRDDLRNQQVIGLLEVPDSRFPLFYTTLDAPKSDKFVRQLIEQSPWLDRLWLSSPILYELWRYIQATTPSHRFVRLGFEHEAWYEAPEVDRATEDDSPDDDNIIPSLTSFERRKSRVHLTERLGILEEKLPQLIALYNPLQSLVQLQIPSATRGGHLLHYDGKATNRTDSFLEHRATVNLVTRLYGRLTERAEQQLWTEVDDDGFDGLSLRGAPVTVRFGEALDPLTFERFVTLGLQRKTSKFRIGGYMRRLGPTKVHLAAIDRHLWQPFLLEATATHLLAILPEGTCGNTVNRLVTNVQRLVDPTAKVWLGSELYSDIVASSLGAAA